ncbi:MAG: PH domain-containing protein [candidate division SR1 bacterium]|nr:PH domain-containing protein [candidate division SR1 bacterium]
MKIFSNFDTNLRNKTFAGYQDHYGVDNVLCFGRSKLYQIYKIIFPLLSTILLTILGLVFFYNWLDGTYFGYIVTAIVIIDIVFLFPVVGKYFDYKMDFIIVIPNSIMMYDQGGIFKRNVHTITAQSIKSISINKAGLFYSMFDNGDIVILTEGDAERDGEIRFRWIPRPEKRKNQIIKIIGIDIQADQNPKI